MLLEGGGGEVVVFGVDLLEYFDFGLEEVVLLGEVGDARSG